VGWKAAVEATLMTIPRPAFVIAGRNNPGEFDQCHAVQLDLRGVLRDALGDEIAVQADAGIVDENVDPAAEAADLGCEFGRRTGCRQIRGDDVDGQPRVLFQQSGAQRGQLVLASGDEHQVGFAIGERDGEILTDPAAGSGDQRGSVLEVHERNRRR